MPVVKEVEIETKAEGAEVVAAIQSAGLKAKLHGEEIIVSGKFFSPVKCSGRLINAEGSWSGTLIITAGAAWTVKIASQLQAAIKRLGK